MTDATPTGEQAIPAALARAFHEAVFHYCYLSRGEPEQWIMYEGIARRVGEIAKFVVPFSDKMPDEVYKLLHDHADHRHRREFLSMTTPAGNTYSSGGYCLHSMYENLMPKVRDDKRSIEDQRRH